MRNMLKLSTKQSALCFFSFPTTMISHPSSQLCTLIKDEPYRRTLGKRTGRFSTFLFSRWPHFWFEIFIICPVKECHIQGGHHIPILPEAGLQTTRNQTDNRLHLCSDSEPLQIVLMLLDTKKTSRFPPLHPYLVHWEFLSTYFQKERAFPCCS